MRYPFRCCAIAIAALGSACDPPCTAPAHAQLLFEGNTDTTMCGRHQFTDDEATTTRFIACVEAAARAGRPFVAPINIGAFAYAPVDNVLVGRTNRGQYEVFVLVGVQPNTSVAKVSVLRCTRELRLVARRNFTSGLNIEHECGGVGDTPNPPYAPGTGQFTGLVCGVDRSLPPYAPQAPRDGGSTEDAGR
jgi:hypothetical protein